MSISPTKTTETDGEVSETIDVGGYRCRTVNDVHFSRIRAEMSVANDFLKLFHWEMGNGGGKGGTSMSFTKDCAYIVKEVSRDDLPTLTRFAKVINDEDSTAASSSSFLMRILAHFVTDQGTHHVAVASVLPDIKDTRWNEIYDLKGCRDDKLLVKSGNRIEEVHMRCWSIPYYCMLSICRSTPKRRQSYYAGKLNAFSGDFFHFTDDVAKRVLDVLQRDSQFLASEGLMDYSLILGVRRCSTDAYVPGKTFPRGVMPQASQPYVSVKNGYVWAYYMGIIDFFQNWNCTKRCAAILKACCAPHPLSTVPPPTYADQFYGHMSTNIAHGVSGTKHVNETTATKEEETVDDEDSLDGKGNVDVVSVRDVSTTKTDAE
eukprot:GSChrysophyteH1.ASY1.ANO1.199.1 assembled CDS